MLFQSCVCDTLGKHSKGWANICGRSIVGGQFINSLIFNSVRALRFIEIEVSVLLMRALQIWRHRQIRLVASLMSAVAHSPWCRKVIRIIDAIPGATRVLVGYRRPFATLDDARRSIAQAAADGHSTTSSIALHADMPLKPRPSDYPAFYYLSQPAKTCKRVFDLGGNVGNLFYYYRSFMPFPDDLEWTVLDLPKVIAAGRQLAVHRSATALHFTEQFADADGADLLIVSGAMHYLDRPLSEMISDLNRWPRYVLINRTPLTAGTAFATVQDAGDFRVACTVSNRSEILLRFAHLGYELVGDWDAAELSIPLPLHPARTVHSYSGLLFCRPS